MQREIKKNFSDLSGNLQIFSFFAFVFLVSISIVTSRVISDRGDSIENPPDISLHVLAAQDPIEKEEESFAKIPVLRESSEFPIISARSVMAIDLDSGISVYEKNPDRKSLPASTTKIMTAIVAMEHFDPAREITIMENGVVGQKMGLVIGETLTVDHLLKGLLIASGNDTAEVLARNYLGGRLEFVKKMNEKVIKLRLSNSFFKNPTGLDEEGQTTTARDLMILATYAMQKSYFADIVGTKELIVQSIDGQIVHKLINTNELLGKVEGVMGTKTGWTENARGNLVTYIERDEKRVIIVLLGSQDRFGETEELIEWVFGSYDWSEVNPNL